MAISPEWSPPQDDVTEGCEAQITYKTNLSLISHDTCVQQKHPYLLFLGGRELNSATLKTKPVSLSSVYALRLITASVETVGPKALDWP